VKDFLAGTCFFLAFFGFTWATCIRCSDWGTERWSKGTHWMKVCGGGLAWFFGFWFLGEVLSGEHRHATLGQAIGAGGGVLLGVSLYALAARICPGFRRQDRKDSQP